MTRASMHQIVGRKTRQRLKHHGPTEFGGKPLTRFQVGCHFGPWHEHSDRPSQFHALAFVEEHVERAVVEQVNRSGRRQLVAMPLQRAHRLFVGRNHEIELLPAQQIQECRLPRPVEIGKR